MSDSIVPFSPSPTPMVPGFLPPDPPAPTAGPMPMLRVLRRNMVLIAVAVTVAVGVAGLASWLVSPVFEGTASIWIEAAPPTPQAVEAARPVAATMRALEVVNDIEVLSSRSMVAFVVDSLAMRVQLTGPRGTSRGDVMQSVRATRGGERGRWRLTHLDGNRFELTSHRGDAPTRTVTIGDSVQVPGATFVLAAAARTRDEIDLEVVPYYAAVEALAATRKIARTDREGDIVGITYRTSDRLLARDVPNAFVAAFMARRRSGRQLEAQRTVEFLRLQLDKLAAELHTAEDSLRMFGEGRQVVNIQEQARREINGVADMQAKRVALDVERSALARLLDDVSRRRASDAGGPSPYRNLAAFPSLVGYQSVSGLLSTLAQVDDRRADLLTRRKLEDPDVQALTARTQALEQQLHNLASTYLQGLTDQLRTLDGALAGAEHQLERFPRDQVEYARLERRTRLLAALDEPLQTRLKQAELSAAVEDVAVRVVDAAVVPWKAVWPKPFLNLALGTVAGLLIGLAIAFVNERADHSIRTRREVEMVTGLPILGLIPHIRVERAPRRAARGKPWSIRMLVPGGALAGGAPPRELPAADATTPALATVNAGSPVAEAYTRLGTNVAYSRGEPGTMRMVVVTSPLPGDGKTTVSINLALTLMETGRRVLLVDADLRRGTIASVFRAPSRPGLADVLSGTVPCDRAIRTIDFESGMRFDLLPSGGPCANPVQLIGSSNAAELFEALRVHYDVIITDTPPVIPVTDAALLGTHSDGMIVVARAGVTAHDALGFAMEQLRGVPAPLIGAVLNDVDYERDALYDTAYRYARDGGAYYTPTGA